VSAHYLYYYEYVDCDCWFDVARFFLHSNSQQFAETRRSFSNGYSIFYHFLSYLYDMRSNNVVFCQENMSRPLLITAVKSEEEGYLYACSSFYNFHSTLSE